MGLDMTIYKTKKVNDFSAIDYYYSNEAFDYYAEKELAKTNGWKFDFSLTKDWGIPETMTQEKSNHYKTFTQNNLLSLKQLLLWKKLTKSMLGLLITFKMELIITLITS